MKNEIYNPHKSSIGGLNANVMALLCYIASVVVSLIPVVRYVAWIAPLVLFALEKQSKFVKFHAMQSFLLHLVSAVLGFLVTVVMSGIIGLLTTAISLVILVFAIIAMAGAYQYKETHIPIIGDIAQRIVQK